MSLPGWWASVPTGALLSWLESHDDDDDWDDVQAEVQERQDQEDANRGAMNGLPPDY